MYKAKYLPVDKPWTDGCTIIDSEGRPSTWDADSCTTKDDTFKSMHKVAELFIVTEEFNEMKIIGRPDAGAQKWVKEGMEFKHYQFKTPAIDLTNVDKTMVLIISCPTCGHIHREKQ